MAVKEKEAEQAIVQVGAEERKVAITFDDVKRYLCPDATDAEIGLFLKVCASENLNPFRGDCFLVKYRKDQKAAIIISVEAFLRAAENCEEYDGHEAGIILRKEDHHLEFRDGSFILEEEEKQLVGGWAKVYRRDRQKPIYAAVNIKECRKYTREQQPTRFWQEMPATMVRKVALSRALREAFPNRFAGTLTTAELEEMPEGELPAAYTKNGEPDWPKFWARQKEKGLTPDDVHGILNIGSLRDDWLAKGRTLEEAEDIINDALEKANKAKSSPEPGVGPPSKPKRDPESIKTLQELFRACYSDWGLQPKEVLKELGYSSQAEISETPGECYRKIQAVRQG